MIDYHTAWKGEHYRVLVAHLESLSPFELSRLVKLYRCPERSAEALATLFCMNPERVWEVVHKKLTTAQAWEALDMLALDHDAATAMDWVEQRTTRALLDLGLIHRCDPQDESQDGPLYEMPAIIASIFASKLTGVRPSLPVLLGRASREHLEALAKRHQVIAGPGLTTMLALSERFMQETLVEELVELLPEPDWLGGALIVLELGGVCYWQDVFGADPDEAPSGRQRGAVVPLMSAEHRMHERDVAQALLELGLIHRFEDPAGGPYPMVAVPEELWRPLWTMGRAWQLEWVEGTFRTLEESASRQDPPATWSGGLQSCAKWLIAESMLEKLILDPGEELHITRLHAKSSGQPSSGQLGLLKELSLFSIEENTLHPDLDNAYEVFEMPRQTFISHVLSAWASCHIGRYIDARLAPAIGLDETWRQQVLDLMDELHDDPLPWMLSQGLSSELTGTGYLRSLDVSDVELLSMEVGLVNSYIWLAKLVWLDLLSMLQPGSWYSLALLFEQLQLVCACTLFEHLGHMLDMGGSAHYIPVQRASFLADVFHMDAFEAWGRDILHHLLLPLGVAKVSEDGQRVCLDVKLLRIPTPPGLPDEDRVQLLRDILHDPSLEFSLAPPRAGFSIVSSPPEVEDEQVLLTESLDDVLRRIRGRSIAAYDGRCIILAREHA